MECPQGQAEDAKQLEVADLQVPEASPAVQRLAERAFGETANPADYLERHATARALEDMETVLFEAGAPALLVAPPGMGKTMLLRVLASRVEEGIRPVELPYGALDYAGLCSWVLGMLGAPATDDPQGALRRAAKQERLLLCVDDASSLPIETARALSELERRRDETRIHVALAAADGYVASRVVAALGEQAREIRLVDPMICDETVRYVRHRLACAGIAEARRDAIPESALQHVHELSGGIPRRVHVAAQQILLRLPTELRPDDGGDEWIGSPLDELGDLGAPTALPEKPAADG